MGWGGARRVSTGVANDKEKGRGVEGPEAAVIS